MKELPKKLKLHSQEGMNEMVLQSWYKINEILDYLESQKDGEEPKHIDVEGLLREYANLVIKNQDMPVTNRELEIINTLKALQQ